MDQMDDMLGMIKELSEDRRVPRNIRALIQQALDSLNDPKEPKNVKLSTAISLLDEATNDPNIPSHTRTQIWNLVGVLESMQSQD